MLKEKAGAHGVAGVHAQQVVGQGRDKEREAAPP